VFRRAQRVRTQPLAGSESWTQEGLQHWRELCSASDWLDAAAELNQLVQTLPQLVHHREQVGGPRPGRPPGLGCN
jgi:U3 small nucleolar RNA-associated protein 20